MSRFMSLDLTFYQVLSDFHRFFKFSVVVYSYKHLVFIGVVSKGNFFLGYIEAVLRVTSLHNISETSKFTEVQQGRRIFF